MGRRHSRVIDADRILGPPDMIYDEELAAVESARRRGVPYETLSSVVPVDPADLDEQVDEYLKEALAGVP